MRAVAALLFLTGCVGGSVTVPHPPSPETTTVQGLRVRADPGDRALGDSLVFALLFRSVRGPDGEYRPSPFFGLDCYRRLDRWDGTTWASVPDTLWRPEALIRQAHRPEAAGILCRDALSGWRPGVSGSRRFAYRLRENAAPGWYRWCTTIYVDGKRDGRWLCSPPVLVRSDASTTG